MPAHTSATLFQWATETMHSGLASVEVLTASGWHVVAAHPWYPGTWLLSRDEDDDQVEPAREPLDDELPGWPDPDAGDDHPDQVGVEGKAL